MEEKTLPNNPPYTFPGISTHLSNSHFHHIYQNSHKNVVIFIVNNLNNFSNKTGMESTIIIVLVKKALLPFLRRLVQHLPRWPRTWVRPPSCRLVLDMHGSSCQSCAPSEGV